MLLAYGTHLCERGGSQGLLRVSTNRNHPGSPLARGLKSKLSSALYSLTRWTKSRVQKPDADKGACFENREDARQHQQPRLRTTSLQVH